MTRTRMMLSLALLALLIGSAPAGTRAQDVPTASGPYQQATIGTRWLESEGGTTIKVLVEASNLGGPEVDVGEITFPVGSSGSGHFHNSVEIFYILSGEFEHTVNGASHVLTPGMVGIVRPGDEVVHKVLSDVPVKAVVIWAPGGEAERLAQFFKQRPLER